MIDWKVPPKDAREMTKIGWMDEAIQTGTNWLRAQRAYQDYDLGIDLMADLSNDKIIPGRSNISTGEIKRDIREHIATLADLRPLWGFKTENRDLYAQMGVLNKLLLSWYMNTFADRGIRKALQWAAAMGKGYISPVYMPDDWTIGRGDVHLLDYGPRDVLIIQPTRDNNLQRAYAVLIRNEVPISLAHSMYPHLQHLIKPDREAPSMMRRGIEKVQRFLSPVLNIVGATSGGKENAPSIFPTVDFWHAYINDDAINETDHDIYMGDPGTSWHYKVPAYKSKLRAGFDKAGHETFRDAERADARVYPFRRLMIATSTCVCYDDTSHYWHGKAPLVDFQFDDWPWEPNGFSMVRGASSVQRSIDRTLRNVDDTLQVRPQPPMQYDNASVPKSVIERLDTKRAGVKVGINMQMGEGVKPFLPAEYYTVDESQFKFVEMLLQVLRRRLGVSDVEAMAKGRTSANPDSLERLMEMAGPLMKDESRGMEFSLRNLGEMMKSNFFQFYTTSRKVQILGEGALTEEDYDYEPGNMIPSHLPGENKDGPSLHTQIERAKFWKDQFAFHVTPNSLHQITQMSRKLMYLQLQKLGFPMDPWTIAELFDIANFGPPPEGANNIIERWMAWQDMEMERKLEMAQKLQEAGIGGGGPGGDKSQPGRKPSYQQSPQLRTKDGGSRSTMTTSK